MNPSCLRRLGSTRFTALALAVALSGCSAIISPDESRLGVLPDAGPEGVDAGPRPDSGGVDAGPITGDDAGPITGDDAGPITGDDAGPINGRDAGVDAGDCDLPTTCVGGVITDCLGARDCPLGCASSADRCAEMAPSNVSSDLWMPGAPSADLVAGEPLRINTTECSSPIGVARMVNQGGGQQACVVSVGSLRIRSGATLAASGRRPLILMANEEVRVDAEGTIDVSARGIEPGPGGAIGGGVGGSPSAGGDGSGESPGHGGQYSPDFDDGGGGGGGFCGGGGGGGDGGSAEGGGPGGAVASNLLQPLRGGSGGGIGNGASAADATNVGRGGAGGGALQISARTLIRVDGSILAGGGGGRGGGVVASGHWGAGGGGGSGGGVLLEAPTVRVEPSASITTSGGGGGGGSSGGAGTPIRAGGPGTDGANTLANANGGAAGGARLGSIGGAGGGAAQLAGAGGDSNPNNGANGGGGGGGAGCVVFRTATGAEPGNARSRSSGSVAPSFSVAPVHTR